MVNNLCNQVIQHSRPIEKQTNFITRVKIVMYHALLDYHRLNTHARFCFLRQVVNPAKITHHNQPYHNNHVH